MEKTHEELYPEQYKHPLRGKQVKVVNPETKTVVAHGIFDRVFQTRFGTLGTVEGDKTAYYVHWFHEDK